jgi:hypothetical protein
VARAGTTRGLPTKLSERPARRNGSRGAARATEPSRDPQRRRQAARASAAPVAGGTPGAGPPPPPTLCIEVSAHQEPGRNAVVAGAICALVAIAVLGFVSIAVALRGGVCAGTCRPVTLLASGLLLAGAILLVHGITQRLRP